MNTENIKTLRWEPAHWLRVGEVANSVGLTRSEFIRRATQAAMVLPSALCGVQSTPHNAASDPSGPLRKRQAKRAGDLEDGEAKEGAAKTDGEAGSEQKRPTA